MKIYISTKLKVVVLTPIIFAIVLAGAYYMGYFYVWFTDVPREYAGKIDRIIWYIAYGTVPYAVILIPWYNKDLILENIRFEKEDKKTK